MTIQGNLIGTDVTGTVALSNGGAGLTLSNAPNNVIGGTTPGAGNVISGNAWDGVKIEGVGTDNNQIQGNRIGTNLAGTRALANGTYGIVVMNGASHNLIGGTAANAGNTVMGNTT
jgi:titin